MTIPTELLSIDVSRNVKKTFRRSCTKISSMIIVPLLYWFTTGFLQQQYLAWQHVLDILLVVRVWKAILQQLSSILNITHYSNRQSNT